MTNEFWALAQTQNLLSSPHVLSIKIRYFPIFAPCCLPRGTKHEFINWDVTLTTKEKVVQKKEEMAKRILLNHPLLFNIVKNKMLN